MHDTYQAAGAPQGIARTQQMVCLRGTRRREGDGIAIAGDDVDNHGRHRQTGRIEDGVIHRQHVAAWGQRGQREVSRGVAARHEIGALDPDLSALEGRRRDQAVEDHAAQHACALSGSRSGESEAQPSAEN